MTRYKLSNNVTISGLEGITEEDIPVKYQEGFYLLSNRIKNREYLINETIRYFISKFDTPKNRNEIIAEVAADVQSGKDQIKKTCTSFLRYLRKKNIVVAEGEDDSIVAEETLYKKGDVLDHYLITDILTNKRSIDVYKAVDKQSDHTCVIKLLSQKKIPNRDKYKKEVGYLLREYDLLQKCNHLPYISSALAFSSDNDGNVYIAQEFIPGKPISRFMGETKGLTKEDSFLVINYMLKAFAALHGALIVHGDIHSANVMVAEDRSVKIIDLGLSIHKEVEEDQVIKYGGVDYYMPPERINTSSKKKFIKAPDFYSDVYQIGLLMYVVIYYSLPYKGFIWEELSAAIKEGKAAFPEKAALGYEVPDEVKFIIKKCLATVPEKRYSTAIDIAKEFEEKMLSIHRPDLTNA